MKYTPRHPSPPNNNKNNNNNNNNIKKKRTEQNETEQSKRKQKQNYKNLGNGGHNLYYFFSQNFFKHGKVSLRKCTIFCYFSAPPVVQSVRNKTCLKVSNISHKTRAPFQGALSLRTNKVFLSGFDSGQQHTGSYTRRPTLVS